MKIDTRQMMRKSVALALLLAATTADRLSRRTTP